jgi:putative ABC transport system ATP-binding protein
MGAPDHPVADEEPIVSLSDVHKMYRVGNPVTVLDGIDLTVRPGSYTAIMGPSGSGKSTLLNLMGCLDTPTSGTIELRGREVTGLSDDALAAIRRTEIGFVFQTFDLMPRLNAVENVELPMVFAGERSRAERNDRARSLLESVGLGDRIDHPPTELSGGQRQRVGIARALANDPKILLADEPTGSLDSRTGRSILDLFQDLNEEGRTVVVVTHERHVAAHADRIVHVLDGSIESIEAVEDHAPDNEEVSWTR